MSRSPDMPAAPGELVAAPPLGTWGRYARRSAESARERGGEAGGSPTAQARARARRELVEIARAYSANLGVPGGGGGGGAGGGADPAPALTADTLIAVAGHQPGFVHPGVWAKYFALERLARESGAIAIDLVVDTDVASKVAASVPSADGGVVSRADFELWHAHGETCYQALPVPGEREIDAFVERLRRALGPFPERAVLHGRLDRLSEALDSARGRAGELGSFLTAVRRRYEGDAHTYLELPVSAVSRSAAYLGFVAGLLLDATRFAECYNAALASHRARHGVRSAAQPFPDLETDGDRGVETPFWLLAGGRRERAYVRGGSGGVELQGETIRCSLPATPGPLADALAREPFLLAPRALTLTLFVRALFADLFVHGTGGASYDRVTDRVASLYWDADMAPYAVTTLTLHAPLGVPLVSDDLVSEAERAVQRFAHNPDEFLGEMRFETPEARAEAHRLTAEKHALVAEISSPDADRATLGKRIRSVNDALRRALAPVETRLVARYEELAAAQRAAHVLADRTFPYFLWDPDDVAAIVRRAP